MKRIDFDGLVCDLDGVVYRGDAPVPGAPAAINELRARGVKVVFCTNNSNATVGSYNDKLRGMGVPVGEDELVTSATVTAEMLQQSGAPIASVLVVGGEGLREAITGIGARIVTEPPADVVAVGLDLGFDYGKMRAASLAVQAGADLVATNDDPAWPTGSGLWPGAGAILKSIEVASGSSARVMGKPHEPMMVAAARRLAGCERIAIAGDRPETDLAGGRARGWTTILVTSGVIRPEDAAAVEPPPDVIVAGLAELVQ